MSRPVTISRFRNKGGEGWFLKHEATAEQNREITAMQTQSHDNAPVVTAFFDDRSDAELAIEELTGAGISNDDVTFTPGNENPASAQEHMGFWDALTNLVTSKDERDLYAEGLRRGGYLVTVRCATNEQHDKALDISREQGSIDIDERADNWRAEGWIH
jgi:hypothetical protein